MKYKVLRQCTANSLAMYILLSNNKRAPLAPLLVSLRLLVWLERLCLMEFAPRGSAYLLMRRDKTCPMSSKILIFCRIFFGLK